ncbi:ATP-grasp domain-containing protein [Peterkaempfera bronchialis]|uniref:ATP-grasp domain-containing protein n=1 Tax=Peterkaempfera bronchialis TaxID=2126346 RepID=A0A345T5Z5_9ACTN|nr:hypothetical protein C7M71_013990 [Peterkaempfera bronchialis]
MREPVTPAGPSPHPRGASVAAQPTVLHVTDLAYPAAGRRYCDEDIQLSTRLREDFTVALCHPLDAVRLMDGFDVVLVRNSGPVLHYRDEYEEFRAQAAARGTRVLNPLTGRGDMAGKRYLLDLTAAGYPVIPTVDRREHLDRLPQSPAYVVKPELGADSIGLRVVGPDELGGLALDGCLVQPRIDFRYEVSFYFVDRVFQYALNAPRPDRRWELAPYRPDAADVEFAQRFVDWNTLDHGIQRVDACRTQDGRLLLVELEDLNPYLSLDLLDGTTRDAFVTAVKRSVRSLLDAG